MKTSKRCLAILLVLALIIPLLPRTAIPVHAETYSGTCGENLTWNFDPDTGLLTIEGTGDMTNYNSNIYVPWYRYRASITAVSLPEGLTSICNFAFHNCTSLTSVTIPANVSSFGTCPFEGCTSLNAIYVDPENQSYSSDGDGVLFTKNKTILICYPGGKTGAYTVPAGVFTIGGYAFASCAGLTAITFPDSLTSIEYDAFEFCSGLVSVTVPAHVTGIGTNAFKGCTNLSAISVAAENSKYSSDGEGVLFNKDKTTLICCPGGKTGQYSIPTGVTDINNSAFYACHLLSAVTIPESVTDIGSYCFLDCSALTAVTIPVGVTEISSYTFYGCSALTSVTMREGVASIGNSAYYRCSSLCAVTIPGSVTSIGGSAFSDCDSLTSVTIPESVTSVGDRAFYACSGLFSATILGRSTSIGNNAFGYRNSTETVPEFTIYGYSDSSAETYALENGFAFVAVDAAQEPDASGTCGENLTWSFFADTGLLTIEGMGPMTDYNSNTYVPWYKYRASISAVSLPEGLTSICSFAFYGCTALTSVTLPSNVTSFGSMPFTGCTNLNAIYVDPENPNYSSDEEGVLFNKDKTILICYPGGKTGAYTVPAGVTEIGGYAFSSCSGLTEITFPDDLIYIRYSAFESCSGLNSVTVPASVRSIGSHVFSDCGNLSAISVDPENQSYSSDEEGVLFNKAKTTLICCPGGKTGQYSIPAEVTTIEEYAFFACHQLTTVTIPERVTDIGSYCFTYCFALTAVTIPAGVTEIKLYTFSSCSALTSVTIPEGVTAIGPSAFANCTTLSSVKIPVSVTSIDRCAFSACPGLPCVTIPSSVTGIGEYAFGYDYNNTSGYVKIPNFSIYGYPNTAAQTYAEENGFTFIALEEPSDPSLSGTCGDNLTWTFDPDTGLLTIEGSGAMTDWSDQNPPPWYDFRNAIKNVSMENGVIHIGSFAFNDCDSLSVVSIPESVSSMGSSAFNKCSALGGVYISDISAWCGISFEDAFANPLAYGHLLYLDGGLLKDPFIPDGVSRIEDYAFYGCTCITSATIPASVEYIGSSAFRKCSSLQRFTVDENNLYYSSDAAGVLFDKSKTALIRCPQAKAGAYRIPNSVVRIEDCAFCSCETLTGITIPEGTESVGQFAFAGCAGLTRVIFPDTVTELGAAAFFGCTKLETAILRNGISGIAKYTFFNCTNLRSLLIPDSVTAIGEAAFFWCDNLSSIILPDSVVSIGDGAFGYCRNLAAVMLPPSVAEIGKEAFLGCFSLTQIAVDSGNQHFSSDNSGVLYDKAKTRLIQCPARFYGDYMIQDTVSVIEDGAFGRCQTLFSVTIPEGVERIGTMAFAGCAALAEIAVPSSVSVIEDYAFMSCTGLWSVQLQSGVERIGRAAFFNCKNLNSIVIPNSAEQIGEYSFGYFNTPKRTTSSIKEMAAQTETRNVEQKALAEPEAESEYRIFDILDYPVVELFNVLAEEYLSSPQVNPGFTIRGVSGSAAEVYADGNDFPFIAVSSCEAGDHENSYAVTRVPTLTRAGELTGTCGVCGKKTTITLPKLNETGYTYAVVRNPSCTEAGIARYTWKMTAYGTFSFNVFLNVTGHSYEAVVTPPACTEQGYTTYTCVCRDSSYIAEYTSPTGHRWDQGVITAAPTDTEPGLRTYTCQSCGEIREELLPYEGHVHRYAASVTPPGCTTPGYTIYRCSGCGDAYIADYAAATGHNYVYTVEQAPTTGAPGRMRGVCAKDGASITLVLPILNTVDYSYKVISQAGCTETGSARYTWRTTAYGTVFFDVVLNAAGHSYQGTVTSPTCTTQGYTTYTCIHGDSQYISDYTSPMGHSWDAGEVTVEPTETEPGEKTYLCRICGALRTEVLPTQGHVHSYERTVTPPTCTAAGYTTCLCSGCGDSYIDSYTAAKGHSYVWELVKEPSVLSSGRLRGTCSEDGETITLVLPNLNETDYDRTVLTPAACTTEGEQRFTWRDTSCGTYGFDLRIYPLGHDYELGVCNRCGCSQDAPDEALPFTDVKESAYYYIAVRWAVNRGIATGTSATTFGPKGTCTRAQVMTFLWNAAGQPEPASPDNPFTDVKPTSYYYKAVLWAVENGIATGTGPTTFGPKGTCTRAQIVTFLWNYAGAPEPATAENPFTDVKPTSYYYKPVLWAYENDVTTGTSPTTFGPKSTCTRAQVVTFLWKALS